MRVGPIAAALAVGTGALVLGPMSSPAGAAISYSTSGTEVSVELLGPELTDLRFTCVDGVVRLRTGLTLPISTPTPTVRCDALTQVNVIARAGHHQIHGDDLIGHGFTRSPRLVTAATFGSIEVWETLAADDLHGGPFTDVFRLRPGGVPNTAVDSGDDPEAAAGDRVVLTGTDGDDVLTASKADRTVTVTATNAQGTTTRTATGMSTVQLEGGAGDDTLTSTGVPHPVPEDPNGLSEPAVVLVGGPGDDALTDGPAGAQLWGGPGANVLTGGGGADEYRTESQADVLHGGGDSAPDRINDADGARAGGRTLDGFTALDQYRVQAVARDATLRVRPSAAGRTLLTSSLSRPGQQVVPASVGSVGFESRPSKGPARALADVVAGPDAVDVTFAPGGRGLLDVTIPTGTSTTRASNGTVEVTSSHGAVRATDVASYRVHGPWTDANQGFAHRVVRDLLFRFPADAERERVRTQLANGSRSRSAVVRSIVFSDEYRGIDVDRIFAQYLRRSADPSGRGYWVRATSGGRALWRFRAQLVGSSEYYRASGWTPEGFVDLAYADIVGRAPDPAGRAYWVAKLRSGTPRASVALQFINTVEARRRIVDDQFLRFLDRLPTSSEQARWVAALPGATGEQDLIVTLAASASYHGRS